MLASTSLLPIASQQGPAQAEVPVATLAHYLARHGMGLDVTAGVQRLAGGLANRNYLVQIDGRSYVLRRPPDGELPPGAHDMVREHRVLSRLWRRFPLAPASLHLCTDRMIIGAPFQVIEYRAGAVVRGDRVPPGFGAGVGLALSTAMIETLADLHSLDPVEVDLGELGRPEGFARRNAEGWASRAKRVTAKEGLHHLVDDVTAWLLEHLPGSEPAVILHCDFKLDNLILDPTSLTPLALVDWDMCTRGHPLFDLATLLSYWAEPGDPGCMRQLAQMPTAQPGFPDRNQMVGRYAALTGRDVSDFPFFRVLAMLKLGVVFLQLHDRWKTGAVSDRRYAEFAALGEDLLLLARDIAMGRVQ